MVSLEDKINELEGRIKRNKEAVDRLVSTAETNTNPYTWLDLD